MTVFDIYPSSENSVLLTWPEKMCPVQHQQILNISETVKQQLHEVVFESIVSYNSLMLYYHFEKITFHQLKQHINEYIEQKRAEEQPLYNTNSLIEIPVYYGEDAGWDLCAVAKQCQLSTQQVIKLHSQRVYRAYALGFTPGFCYLGSLDNKLILNRKTTPRLTVPRGAIAIAEQQTAVYPNESPGGWHIIGQTPVPLFDSNNEQFKPKITVGQQVKFIEINEKQFLKISGEQPHLERSN
ncbi:5-oxoprolinase subunit PxpB [Colwelliaceae bacterium 6441]